MASRFSVDYSLCSERSPRPSWGSSHWGKIEMTESETIILVILGGALGSVARYLTQALFSQQRKIPGWVVIGGVNFAGCLLIGLLTGSLEELPRMNDGIGGLPGGTLLWVSFCGGLTTFSTFSLDNFLLMHHHRGQFALNFFGSLVGGWGMVLIGLLVAQEIF